MHLLRSRSVGTARKPLAWLHTPRLGHGIFFGRCGKQRAPSVNVRHQLPCLYLLGALHSPPTPCAVVSHPTAPLDDAPLMKLLASVGLQPTTLEGDDTVRLAYGGGGGGDMAGVRPALETQLSSKALKAKDLYQGGCMAPRHRLELRTLACRCRGFRYCPRRGCRYAVVAYCCPSSCVCYCRFICCYFCYCCGFVACYFLLAVVMVLLVREGPGLEDLITDEVGLRCILLPMLASSGSPALLLWAPSSAARAAMRPLPSPWW